MQKNKKAALLAAYALELIYKEFQGIASLFIERIYFYAKPIFRIKH
jgi:hypothetical protein